MFSSLRFRLWLSYGLLIATALGIVTVILFVNLLRNPLLYRQTLERLRAVQTILVNRETSLQEQPVSLAAEQASRLFKVRIIQYSQAREVLLDTYVEDYPPMTFPGKKAPSRSLPLVRDSSGVVWMYSVEKLPDNSYLMVAVPRPRISLSSIFADDFLPRIVQSGLFALLLSLFVAFIFARWIADPLQEIIFVAGKLPFTEVRAVEVDGPQEVQELIRAFNAMAARVQASQRSQRDFVANVSHELKTPLTSIQGFSQAILDDTAQSKQDLKKAAQAIHDESGRMHRMVIDLLDLTKLDSGISDMSMAPVDMHALISAVVEKLEPQSKNAGVTVETFVPEQLPPLTADGDRLAQVLTNLMDNAIKFTPRGGSLWIQASVINDQMVVAVKDSGSGISPEVQGRIFERFYRGDASRGGGKGHGAGLGLAIAHEIVHAHGGRISVRSRPGAGATFEVSLPLKPSMGAEKTGINQVPCL